jgi:hypothetical protein
VERVFYLAEKVASEDLRIVAVVTPFLDVYCMGITQYIMPPRISCNVMTLKELLVSSRETWT